MNSYTITTLDEAPAMTRTKLPFVGSFDEAVVLSRGRRAVKLWVVS